MKYSQNLIDNLVAKFVDEIFNDLYNHSVLGKEASLVIISKNTGKLD
jgi:hypothetical protein